MFLKNLLLTFSMVKLMMTGGENIMVLVCVSLIINRPEKWNITKMPVNLQPQILAELNAMGLDGYGKPLEPTPVPAE